MGQFPIMIVQPSTPQAHQHLSQQASTTVLHQQQQHSKSSTSNIDNKILDNSNSSATSSASSSISPPPSVSPHLNNNNNSSSSSSSSSTPNIPTVVSSYAPLALSPSSSSSLLHSSASSSSSSQGNSSSLALLNSNYQLTAAEKSSVDAMLQHFAQNFSNSMVPQQQQSQPTQQQQQHLSYLSPLQLLQHQDAQNTSIMDKIKQLENVIVHQNALVSQLLGNFCMNSAPKIEGVLPAKWAPLLQVCEVILTIRDKKTMKLLGYNQTYLKFLKTKNVGAPMCDAEPFKKINDTWMILILLTLIRDTIENRVETRFQKLSCKSLLNFAPDCVSLVQSTVHFEDADVFWIECKEVVRYCYLKAAVLLLTLSLTLFCFNL